MALRYDKTRLKANALRRVFVNKSALQAPGLAIHVLHHDVVDLAQGGAVFQHLPGLVGVEVDLDQLVVAHGQQAVASKFSSK